MFFYVFLLFNPRGAGIFKKQKDHFRSWRHIGWRNTKICIHGASQMERHRGKCWKSPIFEGKLWVFISYLSEMEIVSIYVLYNSSSTFYSLFLPFFVLEIFKFKYAWQVFVRYSASITKFEWFEQPWYVLVAIQTSQLSSRFRVTQFHCLPRGLTVGYYHFSWCFTNFSIGCIFYSQFSKKNRGNTICQKNNPWFTRNY